MSKDDKRSIFQTSSHHHHHSGHATNGDESNDGPPSWCRCGHCHKRKTKKEEVCCIDYGLGKNGECILALDAERFAAVSLNEAVLIAAVRNTGHTGMDRPDNQDIRKAAYRNFELIHFGYQGPSIRMCIPSCVVECIRKKFPATDGKYMGFIEWAQAE